MNNCRCFCSMHLQMSQQNNTAISHKNVPRSGFNILCQLLSNMEKHSMIWVSASYTKKSSLQHRDQTTVSFLFYLPQIFFRMVTNLQRRVCLLANRYFCKMNRMGKIVKSTHLTEAPKAFDLHTTNLDSPVTHNNQKDDYFKRPVSTGQWL